MEVLSEPFGNGEGRSSASRATRRRRGNIQRAPGHKGTVEHVPTNVREPALTGCSSKRTGRQHATRCCLSTSNYMRQVTKRVLTVAVRARTYGLSQIPVVESVARSFRPPPVPRWTGPSASMQVWAAAVDEYESGSADPKQSSAAERTGHSSAKVMLVIGGRRSSLPKSPSRTKQQRAAGTPVAVPGEPGRLHGGASRRA